MTGAAGDVHAEDETCWSSLMRSAQQGDEGCYRSLLQELSSVIERYLASRIGRHDFIEDIAQEALLAVHEARHTWQPDRPFRPWLFSIVRHKAIDNLRWHKARKHMLGKRAHCMYETALYAIPATVAGLWFARLRYPLEPRRSALLIGLGAGLMPALGMQLACMHDPLHGLLFHLLPGLSVAGIGVAIAAVWWRNT